MEIRIIVETSEVLQLVRVITAILGNGPTVKTEEPPANSKSV
jgi:hypothetical protein